MRIGILLAGLLLASCSSSPVRSPASIESDMIVYGDIDPNQSAVKTFPPQTSGEDSRHLFFVELNDSSGLPVDCDPTDIYLKTNKGKNLDFKLDRSQKGKYYLSLDRDPRLRARRLRIYIGKTPLNQEIKLSSQKTDRNKSWLKAIQAERNGIRFRLFLGDKKGKPVEVSSSPEIIIDGLAQVEGMEKVGDGTWEFSLVYPNYNQVIYVSVRSQGVFMADMYRIQHIEK